MQRAHNPTKPGCPVLVSQPGRGISVNQCGRKINRRGVCGLHASAEERAEAKEQYRRETEEKARSDMAAALERVRLLSAGLGVELQLVTRTPYEGAEKFITMPTEQVRVNIEDLESLLERRK